MREESRLSDRVDRSAMVTERSSWQALVIWAQACVLRKDWFYCLTLRTSQYGWWERHARTCKSSHNDSCRSGRTCRS